MFETIKEQTMLTLKEKMIDIIIEHIEWEIEEEQIEDLEIALDFDLGLIDAEREDVKDLALVRERLEEQTDENFLEVYDYFIASA